MEEFLSSNQLILPNKPTLKLGIFYQQNEQANQRLCSGG